MERRKRVLRELELGVGRRRRLECLYLRWSVALTLEMKHRYTLPTQAREVVEGLTGPVATILERKGEI
ncbi:hypothetical protein PM082_018110 [Marasmius tenuissimus]|nr:hypothetical protein PM082_018110 [Marasmius tenuissimus]